MKLLILISSLVAAISVKSFYGGYASQAALGFPYAYAHGYAAIQAPVLRTISAPVAAVRTIAVPIPAVRTISAPLTSAVITKSTPSVVSSQFHSQDEAGNYAFGYDNINSARVESGNSAMVVTGSYTDKDQGKTVNFVSDNLGFREI